MAHFARIDNGIVTEILVVSDDQEHRGHDYLAVDLSLGGNWLQTSYNTHGGEHSKGGTPLRKNYAGLGYTYDEARDAFIPPQPYASWLLNENTCLWDPPVAYPTDGASYTWDEDNQTWEPA